MNGWTLIKKSLRYYRRTHLGVIIGAAVSTAVLVAALVVGDSVRYSLQRLVLDRLGAASWALQTGERLFPTDLADRLETALDVPTAALLATRGMAINGKDYRANRVQILGVDERFDRMGDCDLYAHLGTDEVILNERLARKINATVGDEILLRLEKPDPMPKDAPLASVEDLSVTLRLGVKAVATAEEFGRFSLKTNQVEPYSAFVSLGALQSRLDLDDRANVLLVAAPDNVPAADLAKHLAEQFSLTDAGYNVVALKNGSELRCERIFIDPPLAQRLGVAFPNAQPIATYLVNELRKGKSSTPYSFVSTANAVGMVLNDDEIVINTWLADDLDARVGDQIVITYYRLGPMRSLIEDTTRFTVKRVVPLSGRYADAGLMPDFPGLSDEENCRDWDAGIPIDLDRIRDKDEQYWDDYRGTPKAFISLPRAKELWGNVFGDITAVRFADPPEPIGERISELLDPTDFGFVFIPVRQIGLDAATHSVDFAGLFIGLSFFLIVAALLLTGLLFVFGVEQRSQESGLLLAVGIGAKKVRRLILGEGAVLAILGALLGLLLGLLFHQVVLWALKTIWKDIVGTSALRIYLKPGTVLMGVFAGIFASLVSMWLAIRRQARRHIADLQKGIYHIDPIQRKRPWLSVAIALLCLVGVALMLASSASGSGAEASENFFIAGTLVLIAGLALTNLWLVKLSRARRSRDLKAVGRRNNARRRSRSLALVAILASGVFLTFTVGANKITVGESAKERESGTGGFALWGETALPLVYDLNSEQGKEFYGLEIDSVRFVQLKVKEGDEASCLNLHKIANPQLLGLQPKEFDARKAFSFAVMADDVDKKHPWMALEKEYEGEVIPGIADQTVIQWSLGLAVGDTLHYIDEQGREFHVRLVAGLANSVFQGNVLISADNFVKHYPSTGGSRVLLIDGPFDRIGEISRSLTWALQDVGLDLIPAADRLAEFNKVTNTYLSIFMILGALGLILGSVGIGVVLLRNVLERRSEMGLLRALGFDLDAIRAMIFAEHIVLLLFGVIIGAAASLIAMLPVLLNPAATVPWLTLVAALIILMLSGVLWTNVASAWALRGELLSSLRNE